MHASLSAIWHLSRLAGAPWPLARQFHHPAAPKHVLPTLQRRGEEAAAGAAGVGAEGCLQPPAGHCFRLRFHNAGHGRPALHGLTTGIPAIAYQVRLLGVCLLFGCGEDLCPRSIASAHHHQPLPLLLAACMCAWSGPDRPWLLQRPVMQCNFFMVGLSLVKADAGSSSSPTMGRAASHELPNSPSRVVRSPYPAQLCLRGRHAAICCDAMGMSV